MIHLSKPKIHTVRPHLTPLRQHTVFKGVQGMHIPGRLAKNRLRTDRRLRGACAALRVRVNRPAPHKTTATTHVPDRMWTSEITYLRTGQCWLHLLCSPRCLLAAVYSAGPSMSTCSPISSSPRSSWRSPRAASGSRRLSCTLTAAVWAVHQRVAGAVRPRAQSDPFSRTHWRVVQKTLPPNHSGRQQKSSSTTDIGAHHHG